MVIGSGRVRFGSVLGGLVCAGLAVGLVSPVWAADGRGGGASAPVVGEFLLGEGVSGRVGERDGSFSFTVPVAGLGLVWDSRGVGVDQYGFGAGWRFELPSVDPVGGVRVAAPTGEVFEADATHPTGLAGYGVLDVKFQAAPGVVPARDDGLAGEVGYAYRMSRLGGEVTYFNDAGHPVVQVTATGERSDWVWDPGTPGRLMGVVSPDGVVTELDWDDPGFVVVRPGANLGATVMPGLADRGWRVELDGGRISGVTGPVGARTDVGYEGGLVSRIGGVSGAVTEVGWRVFDDGMPRAERVRTVGSSTGVELSSRSWEPVGEHLPSGWPAYGSGERGLFFAGDPGFGYDTVVSDGVTKVRSTYSSLHLLQTQRTAVATAAGEHELRAQAYTYPGGADGAVMPDPGALPGNWSRPTRVETTFTNPSGGARTLAESYRFDDLGRLEHHQAADGTITETAYDQDAPGNTAPGAPPIGLKVRETITAPDGLTADTVHTVNEQRTAVVASETHTGGPEQPATVTSRTEYQVETDGFVSERRVFPAGTEQDPVLTRWEEATDLGAGTVTTTEVTAAGTDVQATTSETKSLLHGGVTAQTDAVGNVSTATFDGLGRQLTGIDPVGNITRAGYESFGLHGRNATVTTGPDQVTTIEERDGLGRVIRTSDNIHAGTPVAGHTRASETRAYPEPGVTVVTDAWGAATTTRQDVFGRTTRTETPAGLVEVAEYDEIANQVRTGTTVTGDLADAELVTVTSLDTAGRVTGMTAARADGFPGRDERTSFDGFGRETTKTDGRLTTQTEHNGYGDPVRTMLTPDPAHPEVDAVTAERRFDGYGHSVQKTLTTATDPLPRSAGTRELDPQGRVSSQTDALGRASTFAYTPDGLLAEQSTGAGQVTEYTYDPATRKQTRVAMHSPVGPPVVTESEYDQVTGLLVGVYEPEDRAGTEISHTYDAFRNPLTTTYPDGRQVSHGYDEHGRKTTTIDVTGATTRYQYDPAGRLTGAVQYAGGGRVIAEVGYAYDEHGRVTTVDRGNQVRTVYTYTSASEIATETTTRGEHTLSARDYTYDAAGNLTRRTDRIQDPRTGDQTVATTAYEYDAFDRLTSSSVHDGDTTDAPTVRRTVYTLAITGDIAGETITTSPDTPGQHTGTRTFEYSPTGELTAITTNGHRATQTYDQAGNLTHAADGTTTTYNAANRPITHTGTTAATTLTRYWADGTRRAQASTDPATGATARTEYHWDGTDLINDTHTGHPAGDGTATYLIGTTRTARTTSSTGTEYYGTDRHGNITDLTNHTGEPTRQYTYTDYGEATETDPNTPNPDTPGAGIGDLARNPFQYSGEQTDPDHTQYLRARSYDPHSIRFTTLDTAELANHYNYADLNPITRTDPTGHSPTQDQIVAGMSVTFDVFHVFFAAMTFFFMSAPTAGASLWAFIGYAAALLGLLADAAGFVVNTLAAVDSNTGTKIFSDADTRGSWVMTAGGIGWIVGAAGVGGAVLSYLKRPAAAAISESATRIAQRTTAATTMTTGPARLGSPASRPVRKSPSREQLSQKPEIELVEVDAIDLSVSGLKPSSEVPRSLRRIIDLDDYSELINVTKAKETSSLSNTTNATATVTNPF